LKRLQPEFVCLYSNRKGNEHQRAGNFLFHGISTLN